MEYVKGRETGKKSEKKEEEEEDEREREREIKGRSRVFRRVVLQGVGKQGRSTSGSTPVVQDGNALVSMQTGRTPPYLTHNRILTWEVADGTLWVRHLSLSLVHHRSFSLSPSLSVL